MCGIAVAIDWDDAEATVRRLVEGVQHRGEITDPIVRLSARTAMGTRRLKIVDGANAVQPQASFDDRIVVSFNGEIYNHEALRRELEAKGVAFRTASDTEVLASALRIWGAGAVERINGMYAFVALDRANGEFLAGRDPFGVKPLYLIQAGAKYLFCSEMRPLLSTVDKGDVMLLPPGHLLTRRNIVRFNPLPITSGATLGRHDPETFDRLLAAAVHIRVPPDLPCAILFSGGVDSALIAHYARQVRPEIPGYFLGDDCAPDYAFAACYADRTGFDLRRVAFDDDDDDESISSRIGDVVEAAETFEPSVVRDGLCSYLLARGIHADGYKVALCGEGADELFAGYAPLELAFAEGDAAGNFVREQCLADMHRTNLQRLDRCSMRFQVEAREPFLDPTVVGYALQLPASALIRRSNGAPMGKAPLRSLWDLYPESLPPLIRDRRKAPMHIGSGLDLSQKNSPWIAYAEREISDREFADGRKRFAAFDLRTKEELLYMTKLAGVLDVTRAPHLTARPRLKFPASQDPAMSQKLLADFLVEESSRAFGG
ncbi:MAG TPA: asparagine synthase-related protein [Roseiarcus sp.]|nr:asparagine synthase-related protein [Roseiarcus sp.]